MFHEAMSPMSTVLDTEALSSIIEAEMIRDPEWVGAMSGNAEYVYRECPPLEIWLDRLSEQDSVGIDQWLASMSNDNIS